MLEEQHLTLELDVPGVSLAGDISLTCELVLTGVEVDAARSPLSPALPGRLLWKDSSILLLEGQGSRFPVEIRDFEEAGGWYPPGAGWHLEWDRTDPSAQFLASVMLLINSRNEAVRSSATSIELEDWQEILLSAMYYDVGRRLIRGMLTCTQFKEFPDEFEEGTVGHSVRLLLGLLFPERPVSSLVEELYQRPDHFETRLQEALQMFGAKAES
ncbi:hypothetical protein ACFL44_00735 [Gemmatimonadota bacterium]